MAGLNIERLTQLRDHLAALDPARFNMAEWAEIPSSPSPSHDTVEDFVHNCNSVACIGGWADALFLDPEDRLITASVATTFELLGLTDAQGNALCFPGSSGPENGWPDYGVGYEDITTTHAVETLDKLINTGKVDWSHVSI